jgi:putative ABC transport system permease protein
MSTILKIAVRNLTRYTRRTLLTATLISIGVIFVIVFGGLASSFKNSMINVITGSLLADIQIHKKGYVESIDNLPLNIFLSTAETAEATKIISE